MKKIILALAVAAVATMAIVGSASAGVQRYQEQKGQLTVTLPDYGLVHKFDITMNPCDGSFRGSSSLDSPVAASETITGTVSNDQLKFTSKYGEQSWAPGYQWFYEGTLAGGTATERYADGTSLEGGFAITSTLNLTNVTNYKNHGEYVNQAGDKADAAHSCIGMPVN